MLAPLLIYLIKDRDPVAQAYESRTKRFAYWKAYLELAQLADKPDVTEVKQACRKEMEEAADELRKVTNRFVNGLASFLALVIMTLAWCLVVLSANRLVELARQDPSGRAVWNVQVVALTYEVLIGCAIWFWVRPRLRDYLWERHLKPGKWAAALVERKTLRAFVFLALLLAITFLMQRFC